MLLKILAANGFKDCVSALIQVGCNVALRDKKNWNPHEHAVFRGHYEIADILKPFITYPPRFSTPSTVEKRTHESRREYGHKILAGQFKVFISFVATGVDEIIEMFQLDKEKTLGMSLSITLAGHTITCDYEMLSETICPFELETIRNACINFKVSIHNHGPTYFGSCFVPQSASNGSMNISLQDKNFECVGSLKFDYVICKPFSNSNFLPGSKRTYWKSVETKVIGHRGLGSNKHHNPAGYSLQLGENTVLSFVTAASLGAEYVEFGKLPL